MLPSSSGCHNPEDRKIGAFFIQSPKLFMRNNEMMKGNVVGHGTII
jgi:hypothetical protein